MLRVSLVCPPLAKDGVHLLGAPGTQVVVAHLGHVKAALLGQQQVVLLVFLQLQHEDVTVTSSSLSGVTCI